MTAKVASSDSGTAMLGITVAHNVRRNMKMTRTTRPIVSIIVNCTSCTAARTTSERSETRSTWTEGGIDSCSCGISCLDRVDELDRVGAGLPLNRQALGRLVVEPGADALVLHRVDDVGDVLEPHRRAVAPGDDDLAKAGGVEQLIVGVEGEDLVRAFEIALRPVDGRRRQRGAHLFEADAARRQRAGVDLDMHRIRSSGRRSATSETPFIVESFCARFV